MGKQTDNNSRNSADDYELKVLIDKCNVCHSNLDTDHHKVCKHHGEAMKASHFDPYPLAARLVLARPRKVAHLTRQTEDLLNYELFALN